jgi:NAD/NADP transhydrogenase beta subunit
LDPPLQFPSPASRHLGHRPRFAGQQPLATSHADKAQNVIVIKRGKGTGYSGVENAMFYTDNCRMLYGDARPMAGEIIQHLKAMG